MDYTPAEILVAEVILQEREDLRGAIFPRVRARTGVEFNSRLYRRAANLANEKDNHAH